MPLVPVIVTVYVPAEVALTFVVMVNVEEPEPVTEGGLNVAEAPGTPLALRLTTSVNPPAPAVTVAVYITLEPAVTDRVAGVAELKIFWTTSVTDVVWIRLPLVPVIVTV